MLRFAAAALAASLIAFTLIPFAAQAQDAQDAPRKNLLRRPLRQGLLAHAKLISAFGPHRTSPSRMSTAPRFDGKGDACCSPTSRRAASRSTGTTKP